MEHHLSNLWTILPLNPHLYGIFHCCLWLPKGTLPSSPKETSENRLRLSTKTAAYCLQGKQLSHVIAILVAEEPSNLFILFDSWEGYPILRHCYIWDTFGYVPWYTRGWSSRLISQWIPTYIHMYIHIYIYTYIYILIPYFRTNRCTQYFWLMLAPD